MPDSVQTLSAFHKEDNTEIIPETKTHRGCYTSSSLAKMSDRVRKDFRTDVCNLQISVNQIYYSYSTKFSGM